ncbi:fructose-6-phosphate aldolase [Chloroflexota bacterium]
MHIFLDTANIEDIRNAAKLGVVSGITTNPSLVAKEKRADMKEVIREIASIIDGPISAEVLSQEPQAMIKEAKEISSWAPNVVVKIPITVGGLEALSALSKDGIKVNLTLCFSVNQAMLGAIAGAAYVSPFVGRLDDVGHDGMQLVEEIVKVYKNYNMSTQVIAASIRHPLHAIAAAKAGAHVATVPYNILMQMIKHPLTDIGNSRFTQDWQRISGS